MHIIAQSVVPSSPIEDYLVSYMALLVLFITISVHIALFFRGRYLFKKLGK